MVFGLDANFSEEALIQRLNSDLANDLGNLFSRTLAMTAKYFGGTVPPSGIRPSRKTRPWNGRSKRPFPSMRKKSPSGPSTRPSWPFGR